MTNTQKEMLKQIPSVAVDKLTTVAAYRQVFSVASMGVALDIEFLQELGEAYKKKGINNFYEQFEEYLIEEHPDRLKALKLTKLQSQVLKKIQENPEQSEETYQLIYGTGFDGRSYKADFLEIVTEQFKALGYPYFQRGFNIWVKNQQENDKKAVEGVKNLIKSKKTKVTTQNGTTVAAQPIINLDPITAEELDKKETPPIEWLVNEILPVGMLLLSAPPKNFKSYMALQLCTTICLGGKFLSFDCNKHACLYLDLESTERRPKNRLNQILGKETPKPNNLYIVTGDKEVKRIGDGFENQIEQQLEEHPDIKLIIVDVYQLIAQAKKGNQNSYDNDYESLRKLKQIADKHNIGIMLIHHNRKMRDGSDVFNDVSGSIAMTGSMDCTWIIQKERNSKEATLNITGRDLEQQQLKIKFNTVSYQWEYLGTAEDLEAQRQQEEYNNSPIVKAIKRLLKLNSGRWEGSASDLKKSSLLMNGREIYDSAEKIGKFINNNKEFMLWFDNIKVENKRVSSKRFFVFSTVTTDTTVITDTTDTTVIDNNIQQELDI